MTDAEGRRFSPAQLLMAGAVVTAGLLIGGGVFGAALLSRSEEPSPTPTATGTPTPTPTPTETDPGVLHTQNQETTRLQAEAQLEEALLSAALAEENYYQAYGSYTSNIADLVTEGLRYPPGVMFTLIRVEQDLYCLEARHDRLADQGAYSIFSQYGQVRREPCPGMG